MTPSSVATRRLESPAPPAPAAPPRAAVLRAAPPLAAAAGPASTHRVPTTAAVTAGGRDPASEGYGIADPVPLATNLARCVFEILAGARDIEQIARWVSDDVYRHLLKRVVLAARARSARGESARRPSFSVGTVRVTEPGEGIVEAVVIIHGRARSRAVALRLEAFGARWRATAVHVL